MVALSGRKVQARLPGRKAVPLSLPVTVPLAMTAVFRLTGDRLGPQAGYTAGFGIYLGTCAALSVALLGPARVRSLFGDVRPRLGRPAAIGAVMLLWPSWARS